MQKSVLWGKKIPQISSKFLGTQPPDEGNAKLHGGWRCLPPPPPEFSLRSLQSQPSGRSVRGVCLQAGHTHSAGTWGARLRGRLPTLTPSAPRHLSRPVPCGPTAPFPRVSTSQREGASPPGQSLEGGGRAEGRGGKTAPKSRGLCAGLEAQRPCCRPT